MAAFRPQGAKPTVRTVPRATEQQRYMDFKFSSTEYATAHTLRLIEMVSNTTQALVALTRDLKSLNLLY
jgi:hypothetical protein